MLKVMFDTNANDAAGLDQDFRNLLIWAQDNKIIELVTTHIQIDQIGAIEDCDKREIPGCINVSAGTTETCGYIPGISKYGWARQAPKENFGEFLGNKIHNRRNLSDALIAITAKEKADIFVTDDGPLFKRTQEKVKTLKTFKSIEFKKFLENLKFQMENIIIRPKVRGKII